jgi:hypothetical protein
MKRKQTINEKLLDLQEKALIVNLGLAGVPQRVIREIVGCDLNRVTRIVRQLPKPASKGSR